MVKFKPYEKEGEVEFRTVLWLVNKQDYENSKSTGAQVQIAYVNSSWYTDYLLVALFIALLAATPIGWKRRFWSFVVGLIFIHAYILFTLYVLLFYQFNFYQELAVLQLSGFWQGIVNFLHPILLLNPGTGIFVALLIWLLVSFNRKDLARLSTAFNRKGVD